MRVFDLELEREQLALMAEHAEREYPREACGLGFADSGGRVRRVLPIANLQDKYHARDPALFPRDARSAFRLDELARLRALEEAEARGERERIIYHSHPDAGAYFSAEDRAMAIFEGQELVPGAVHVVISVREGQRADAAAFRYDEASATFLEARLPLVNHARSSGPLPDLELRLMEGGEATRPIPPVAGRLAPRVVTAEERERLHALSLPTLVVPPAVVRDLAHLGGGLLSPLGGFLRKAERESVDARGRLLSGVPWRASVSLRVRAPAVGLEVSSMIELVAADGRALAVLAVEEVERAGGEWELAGPVYVYEGTVPSAVDARAWLLRAGARQVLAIPEGRPAPSSGALLGFDALIAPAGLSLPVERPRWEAPESLEETWLGAAIAQNLGATHFHTQDPSVARAVRDSLLIRPFPEEPTPV